MKPEKLLRSFVCSILVILACISSSGQAGKGFNYQAVARNSNGEVMAKIDLTVRIGILNVEQDNELMWLEEHQVSTSNLGIINLTVGANPDFRIDGKAPLFEEINWQEGSYALNVQIKEQGGEFTDLGSSLITAVPMALVSEQVKQPLAQFTIQNNGDLPPETALFEVRNTEGRPIFAVYEDGVWVYTDTSDSKGVKGGFAVGGYRRSTKGGVSEEYMRVTPDSVRIYINEDPAKGVKGGFAVGGYRRSTKAGSPDYMSVFSDSIRFHVGYDPAKGRVGGFGISGTNPSTGQPATYLFLTPENYFIGERSGINNTTGIYNTVIGYRAGENNTEGSQNVMLGYVSGNNNINGHKNVFVGDSAGYQNINGEGNVFLGRSAGLNNETGDLNILIGAAAGKQNSTGSKNLFLGSFTGLDNVDGSNNCFLGQFAGLHTNAFANVFIGNSSGSRHYEGNDNVFIGNGAGWGNYSGMANVYIGRRAGTNSDTSSFNVALGNRAGESLNKGEMNVLIGNSAGSSIIETWHNTFVGANSGEFTEYGSYNTFIGNNSGLSNVSGYDNTYVGAEAGKNNTGGIENVCIGIGAGENNMGNSNVFLGSWAGQESDGSGNVFIGNTAGRDFSGSDMLIIDNGDANGFKNFIWGSFSEDKLRLNAFVGISTRPDSAFSLKTIGDINANDVTTVSDARYKTNIESIPEALDLVQALEGVRYRWNMEKFPAMHFKEGMHYGFIAQDMEQVIPDLVNTGSDGYKSVNYQKINTILVEAVKQQQSMLVERDHKIRELEIRLERIEAALLK